MLKSLDEQELSFFKRFGYLIKQQAVAVARCAEALERMWQTAPAHLDRDDPSSWRAVPAELASDDPLLTLRDCRWQYRGAATEPVLLDLVFDAQLVLWAEQLLGAGTLRAPTPGGKPMGSWGPAWPGGPVDPQLGEGARGIYATLPDHGADVPASERLHTDGHPFHLGLVCLLDDCPADGGAFTVWPGSHRRFYPLFPMQYDQARVPYYEHLPAHKGLVHPPAYLAEVAQVAADTEPVSCHGRAGDVVFWHHRLGHMAGQNQAEPPVIRQAVLYDFCKTDLDQARLQPPQANMWQDWSVQLQRADAQLSAEFVATQHLPSSLLRASSRG